MNRKQDIRTLRKLLATIGSPLPPDADRRSIESALERAGVNVTRSTSGTCTCEVCGRKIEYKWKPRRTCDENCRSILHARQMRDFHNKPSECQQCGSKFVRRCVSQKYCCNDCRGDADAKRAAKLRTDPTAAEIAAETARMKAAVLYPEQQPKKVNKYRQVMQTAQRVAGVRW